MIYQSVFGWISTILSIACGVWLIGLGIFVIVRLIIEKVQAKRLISKAEKDCDDIIHHEIKRNESKQKDIKD